MRSASRLVVAVVIAASLVALAPVAASAVGGHTAQPRAWVHKFCAGGATWIHKLKSASDAIADDLGTPPDPARISEALVAFFTAAASSTGEYSDLLHDAGVPDVPHGKNIAKALRKSVTKVRRSFARAKTAAAKLESSNGAELQAGLDAARKAFQDGLAKVASSTADVLRSSGSRKLAKTLRGEDACQLFLPPTG
jgi:hypothetical protein